MLLKQRDLIGGMSRLLLQSNEGEQRREEDYHISRRWSGGARFGYFRPLLSGNFAEGVGYRTDKEGENGF